MFGAVALGAPNPPEGDADDGAPDLLKGGAGDDTLEGGGGADVLVTSAGRDTVSTGTGNDRVFATKGDKLTTPCSADDQVRFLGAPTSGATGELRPDGCARLPSDERVPVVWPQPPAAADASGSAPSAVTALAAVLPDSVRAPTAKVAQVGNAKSIAVTIPDRNQNLRVPICVRTVDGKRKKLDAFSDEIHSKTPDKVKLPKSSRKARTARIAVRKMRTSGRGPSADPLPMTGEDRPGARDQRHGGAAGFLRAPHGEFAQATPSRPT